MNRKLGLGAIVGSLTAALALSLAVTATPAADAHSGHGAAAEKAAFHDAMRVLWEDHIVWTRQFIVSAATASGDLPDIGPTADRLLANQTDIGNALKPFYGDAAGDQVTALLRDHILTAADLIARADLSALIGRQSPALTAELMVVGTVVGDALIAGLRRLAHQEATAELFPASVEAGQNANERTEGKDES